MFAVAEACIETTQFRAQGAKALTMSAVEHRFVGNWGRLSAAFGMGEVTGQVHAVLFLSDHPLSAAEVARCINVSSAEAAVELSRLLDFGAVSAVSKDPKKFMAETDPWTFFASVVRHRAAREFAPMLTAIRSLNDVARDAHNEGQLSRSRMQRIASFSQFVDQVARMLETFGGGASSKPMLSAAKVVARFFR